jgi:hypothetical protein
MLEVKKFNCAAAHVRRSDFIFLDQRAVCFVTIRLIGIAGTFSHSPKQVRNRMRRIRERVLALALSTRLLGPRGEERGRRQYRNSSAGREK